MRMFDLVVYSSIKSYSQTDTVAISGVVILVFKSFRFVFRQCQSLLKHNLMLK